MLISETWASLTEKVLDPKRVVGTGVLGRDLSVGYYEMGIRGHVEWVSVLLQGAVAALFLAIYYIFNMGKYTDNS